MSQLSHDEVAFAAKNFPIVLILHELRSPANIGSIFRLADAFGAEKIMLSNCDFNPESSRFKRTARNTENAVSHQTCESSEKVITHLRKDGYKIISLEITSESIAIDELEIKHSEKIGLVIGAERHGISNDILKLSDYTAHINMFGENSSMNVAQATGIALFQITKTLTGSLQK